MRFTHCHYWHTFGEKKKKPTREWEGMGVILPGVERDGIFPQFFVGLGREEINFCGSGTGEV